MPRHPGFVSSGWYEVVLAGETETKVAIVRLGDDGDPYYGSNERRNRISITGTTRFFPFRDFKSRPSVSAEVLSDLYLEESNFTSVRAIPPMSGLYFALGTENEWTVVKVESNGTWPVAWIGSEEGSDLFSVGMFGPPVVLPADVEANPR